MLYEVRADRTLHSTVLYYSTVHYTTLQYTVLRCRAVSNNKPRMASQALEIVDITKARGYSTKHLVV